MSTLYFKYKKLWTKERGISVLWAIILAVVAVVAQKMADIYVDGLHGAYVGDLILDHIPTINVDDFIVILALFLTFAGLLLVILKPKYIFFTLKTLALFIIIRSFFISLTHLGISPHQIIFDTHDIGYALYNFLYNTKGDFFFSAHTGIPALMALIFWNEKKIRIFFIIASCVMGASVLFAHIHYSIDVFAAPFMAYGIFALAKKFFKRDYKLLGNDLGND